MLSSTNTTLEKVATEDRLLFRVMRAAEDGYPRLGHSASTLGIRAQGRDKRPDIVVEGGYVRPRCGGMSVTPDDWRKIYFVFLQNALDDEEPDQVWCLQQKYLGEDLVFRPDYDKPTEHGFIEPAQRMSLERYEAAIEATRTYWQVYSIRETDEQ